MKDFMKELAIFLFLFFFTVIKFSETQDKVQIYFTAPLTR